MRRRDLFVGFGGYSLVVLANQLPPSQSAPPASALSQRFEAKLQ